MCVYVCDVRRRVKREREREEEELATLDAHTNGCTQGYPRNGGLKGTCVRLVQVYSLDDVRLLLRTPMNEEERRGKETERERERERNY